MEMLYPTAGEIFFSRLILFGNSGIPPHILELKIGDICIVLRNLSIRDGLQNNARVRITHITKYAIRVQTI